MASFLRTRPQELTAFTGFLRAFIKSSCVPFVIKDNEYLLSRTGTCRWPTIGGKRVLGQPRRRRLEPPAGTADPHQSSGLDANRSARLQIPDVCQPSLRQVIERFPMGMPELRQCSAHQCILIFFWSSRRKPGSRQCPLGQSSNRPYPSPNGFPVGNPFRRTKPAPVVAVTLTAWCPLIRVLRRASDNACGPSRWSLMTRAPSREAYRACFASAYCEVQLFYSK
jgi:hypothetical protein